MADELDDDAVLRRLWASVIIQHLIDATCNPTSPAAHVHKRQARAWFVTEVGTTAQDFEEVCMSANVDYARVRAFVREYDGPPLTAQSLARMRNLILSGGPALEDHN